MGCQCVGLCRIQRFSVYFHIINLVRTTDLYKFFLFIQFYRRLKVLMNAVAQTGNLQEAAVLTRTDIP